MTSMRWEKFSRTLNDAQTVFIYDTVKNGKVNGHLRALPAILYGGFGDVTCPKGFLRVSDYGRHQLYEYNWHLLQDLDGREFDLVACTNQYYERELGIFSLRTLLKRYAKTGRRLVVLGDQPSFEVSGMVRPLREDPVVTASFSYDEVYEAYKQFYRMHDYELPLKGTKNLFLQDNALCYEASTNKSISTIEELIEILPRAPYLPIVKGLSTIFSAKDLGSEPLESTESIEGFGKWLRRRVELTYQEALSTARTINEYASAHERLFDAASRRRMTEMSVADSGVRELEGDANPIADRHRQWLRRTV